MMSSNDVIQLHQDRDGHVDLGISEQPDLADAVSLGRRRGISRLWDGERVAAGDLKVQ